MRQAIRNFMVGTDGTAGAALVEFAVIAPVIGVIIVWIMDLGLFGYRQMQVQHAAQAGAQYAILVGEGEDSYSSSAISAAVTNATTFKISASPAPSQFFGCPSNAGVTDVAQNSTCPDGKVAGSYVTVSAQATYNPVVLMVPGKLFPSTIFASRSYTLKASATVRIQ